MLYYLLQRPEEPKGDNNKICMYYRTRIECYNDGTQEKIWEYKSFSGLWFRTHLDPDYLLEILTPAN